MRAVRISRDVLFRDLEGEAVILDLASGRYFGLNPIGTRIWMLLDGGAPVDEIVATLADEYEAERERIERDVTALIDELSSRGLLVASDDPPSP